jgi:uncharacterized protein YecT (DUF1311 family)
MIFAILLATAAVQQAADDDPIETACYARDYSQQAMNRCAGDAFERADKALNAQWAKVLAAYGDDAEAKKLLLDGQRAWLTYRDTTCALSAFDSRGGSIWPLINSMCLAQLTRERTAQLVELLEGEL